MENQNQCIQTNLIYFTHKRRLSNNKLLLFYNQPIEEKNYLKYLGVTLDKKLNFNQHIHEIIRKTNSQLSSVFPLICRDSKLSIKSKLKIYKQGIRPMILYASPVWSKTSKTNYDKLQRIQNKYLRIILNKPKETKTSDLQKDSQIDSLDNVIKNETRSFFGIKITKLKKTSHLNNYSIPVRKIKHKLIQHLMM